MMQLDFNIVVYFTTYMEYSTFYLMEDSMTDKKMKIVFDPGCFDNFEGTQEDLDSIIAELTQLVESGELMSKAVPLDPDDEIEFMALKKPRILN